jgi:hypothetical protein
MNRKLKALDYNEQFEMPSGETMALLRILLPKQSLASQFGCYIKDGILYRPKKVPLATHYSPVLENAEAATQEHNKKKEFYPNKEEIEKALSLGYCKLPSREDFSIPISKLGENEFARFMFGEYAAPYGEFLHILGINEIQVVLVNRDYVDSDVHEGKTFSRQSWMSNIHQNGGIMSNTGIDFDCRLREVLKTDDPYIFDAIEELIESPIFDDEN